MQNVPQADLNKIDVNMVKKFTALIWRNGAQVREVYELNEGAAERIQPMQSEIVSAVYRGDIAPFGHTFSDLSVEDNGTHILIFFANGTVTELRHDTLAAQVLCECPAVPDESEFVQAPKQPGLIIHVDESGSYIGCEKIEQTGDPEKDSHQVYETPAELPTTPPVFEITGSSLAPEDAARGYSWTLDAKKL